MLDQFFYDRLADSPESATRLGLDTGTRAALRGKLSDTSAAGVARGPGVGRALYITVAYN